jgi:hypothetical protein
MALGFFWIHMLLIAAAAVRDARDLRARPFGPSRRARVEGDLHLRVTQVGRSKGDRRIHFHDRAALCEHDDLEFHFEDGTKIIAAKDTVVEFWPDASQIDASARCPDAEAFDLAYKSAQQARGFVRDLVVPLPGDSVYVTEERSRFIVSPTPPATFVHARSRIVAAFVLAILLVLAACTTLILWPPLFGTLGMFGAIAAVGLHQLMQLVGKNVHDALRPPCSARVGGEWKRPA